MAGIAHGVPYRAYCKAGKVMKRHFLFVLMVLSWTCAFSLASSFQGIASFFFMCIGIYCTKLFLEDNA